MTDLYPQSDSSAKEYPCASMGTKHIDENHGEVSEVLKAALAYAERGWRVLPLYEPTETGCSCGKAACTKPGKHPRTRHGWQDATSDPARIQEWFLDWPTASIGIATGACSGLVVLDVDDTESHSGSDTVNELFTEYHDSLTTMIVRTGRGYHFYFSHPGGDISCSAGKLGPGLDVRADGGYVVAPPSKHANGRSYTVECDEEAEELPTWLLSLMREPKAEASKKAKDSVEMADGHPIIEGTRNDTLFKLACRLRGHEGMERRDLERVLLSYNSEQCEPPLPSSEVLQIVVSACQYPPEKTSAKSLRRQNENPLWWLRFDVRHWFSDSNVTAMTDFQRGWYIRLFVLAWNRGGFLTADQKQLWRLAGASSQRHFQKHCNLVLADFDLMTEHDGTMVYRHRFMAGEYASALKKWMAKVGAGSERQKQIAYRKATTDADEWTAPYNRPYYSEVGANELPSVVSR